MINKIRIILFSLTLFMCVFQQAEPSWAVATWHSIGSPGGGQINAIAIDPTNSQIVYAGTNGGVFKTIDGGASWIGLTNTVTRSLAIDPTNSQIVYAGTNGYVFQTTNGGALWTPMKTGATAFSYPTEAVSLVIDSVRGQLYAGTQGGAFRYNGYQWYYMNTGLTNPTVPSLPLNVTSLAKQPSSSTYYAGTGGGVFKYLYGYDSWNAINTGLTNTDIRSIAIDDWLVFYVGTQGGGVFKTTNSGTSWTSMNAGLTNTDIRSLAIDPVNRQIVYAGTYTGGIFKTTDGGASWNEMNTGLTNTYVTGLAIDPVKSNVVYAGTGGGVFAITFSTLDVTKSGAGTVTSSPGGINCGSICSGDYSVGQEVTLTATPDAGYTFAGWTGGGCSGVGPCSVSLGSNTTIKATFTTPNTLKWSFATGDIVYSSPSIGADGTIYVGSYDKKLYAINQNGTLKWTYNTGSLGNYIYSSPSIGADGTIYVGSDDKKLYAINPNGTLKWSYTTGGRISSSPAIGADGTIYVGSDDKKLYGFSPSGGMRMIYATGGGISSSPSIGADGTIYVGSEDNKLYAVNPNGSLKWFYTTGGSVVCSSPAIGADGTIYVGSYDNNIYAINPDGTLKWYYATGGIVYSSPSIGADGTIYVGSYDKKLYAINPNGTLKWTYTTGSIIFHSSPAIGADGTIYVGSNMLYAINPNGTLKWSNTVGIHSSSPAIGADGTIYVGSDDKKLYAFDSSSLGLASSAWPKFGHDPKHTGNITITYLTVINSGAGIGVVSSSPSGINCGSTCSASFTSGTSVTLTATPDAYSTLADWAGACSGAQTNCQMTMDSDKAVTATFTTKDVTDPTGTLIINDGATYTNNSNVMLSLWALDPSGVFQMQFSNGSDIWSDPESYGTTKSWMLEGENLQTVYARFKDGAGNWSAPVSSKINYDWWAPTGTVVINGGVGYTNNAAVMLTLWASDGPGNSEMQFSNDNTIWSDPEPYATTKSWTLSIDEGIKAVYVKFKDVAGNWSAPISATTYLDTVAPMTTINTKPASIANATTASFTFSANEASNFQCQLDSGGFSTCASPKAYTGVTEGSHTFTVKATDTYGNIEVTPATYSWSIDSLAPTLSIGSPSATVTKSGPVTYAVTYTGADAVTFADANVTLNKTGTANGTVTVSGTGTTTRTVTISGITGDGTLGISIAAGTASDSAGNLAAAGGASGTITVDNTAPAVNAGGNQTKNTIFTQTATATDTNAMTYAWSKQAGSGTVTFGTITALSTTISASLDGTYVIRFTAIDAAGNSSFSDMTLVWDTTAPTVAIGSSSIAITKSGPVTYTVTYTGADSITLAGANVTLIKTGTANGTVTVSGTGNTIRTVTISGITGDGTLGISIVAGTASDSVGNMASAAGPSGTFTADNTRPITTMGAKPADPTTATTASVTFAASEAATFQCQLDSGGFSACVSPKTYTGVAEGSHTFTVTATDTAGNTEALPPSYTWTVDITKPVVGANFAGGIYTNAGTVTLTLSGTDTSDLAGMMFSWDGGASWDAEETYGTTKTWNLGSSDGLKTVYVKFKDKAGNWSDPYRYDLTLDTVPPALNVTPHGPCTNNPAITVSGTAMDSLSGLKDVTVNGTEVTAPSGSFSQALTLVSGSNTIVIAATDNAGNVTTVTQLITLDQVPPLLTLSVPSNDSKTNQSSVMVQGTVDEAVTATTKVNNGSVHALTVTNNSFSSQVTLNYGLNTIEVTATDGAGNLMTVTRTIYYGHMGDIDGDGNLTMIDAIMAIQVLSRVQPPMATYWQADVNGDNRLGMEEAIYILQMLSEMR
jgi:outer membrane protein assembly factor BamB